MYPQYVWLVICKRLVLKIKKHARFVDSNFLLNFTKHNLKVKYKATSIKNLQNQISIYKNLKYMLVQNFVCNYICDPDFLFASLFVHVIKLLVSRIKIFWDWFFYRVRENYPPLSVLNHWQIQSRTFPKPFFVFIDSHGSLVLFSLPL